MIKYNVDVYDDIVPEDLRWSVWEYIQNQTFHGTRKDISYPNPGSAIYYKPIENKKEYLDDTVPSSNSCLFNIIRTWYIFNYIYLCYIAAAVYVFHIFLFP